MFISILFTLSIPTFYLFIHLRCLTDISSQRMLRSLRLTHAHLGKGSHLTLWADGVNINGLANNVFFSPQNARVVLPSRPAALDPAIAVQHKRLYRIQAAVAPQRVNAHR